MESCRIINIKVGRVGGFSEAIAVHNAAAERGIPVWCGGMLETGIGRSHNIALSSLPNFSLPGDVSASSRYWAQDIIEPAVTVSAKGEIVVPTTVGRGFEVQRDRIEALTVRRQTLFAKGPRHRLRLPIIDPAAVSPATDESHPGSSSAQASENRSPSQWSECSASSPSARAHLAAWKNP